MKVFNHMFNSLIALVPSPPDFSILMTKNVVMSHKIMNSMKFKLAIADSLPNYD